MSSWVEIRCLLSVSESKCDQIMNQLLLMVLRGLERPQKVEVSVKMILFPNRGESAYRLEPGLGDKGTSLMISMLTVRSTLR